MKIKILNMIDPFICITSSWLLSKLVNHEFSAVLPFGVSQLRLESNCLWMLFWIMDLLKGEVLIEEIKLQMSQLEPFR